MDEITKLKTKVKKLESFINEIQAKWEDEIDEIYERLRNLEDYDVIDAFEALPEFEEE